MSRFIIITPDQAFEQRTRVAAAGMPGSLQHFNAEYLPSTPSGTGPRNAEIRLELPNALDQMLISVQAGLGFEAAMSRAGEFNNGPLADDLIRTLQDIQVGRGPKEAYLALAQRVDVPDVRIASLTAVSAR